MAKTKTNKKTFIIVLFLVLVVALGIGYAAFSDTLLISGTANANGNFDLQFTAAEIVKATGVDTTNTTAVIDSTDHDTLTVNVADLGYPGAGVQFHAVITNLGTVPAVVTGVTPTNITGNSHAIKISGLDAITTSHPTIQPNGTCAVDFTVEWDPTVNELNDTTNGESCTFSLQIEYGQANVELFNGTTDHNDVNP